MTLGAVYLSILVVLNVAVPSMLEGSPSVNDSFLTSIDATNQDLLIKSLVRAETNGTNPSSKNSTRVVPPELIPLYRVVASYLHDFAKLTDTSDSSEDYRDSHSHQVIAGALQLEMLAMVNGNHLFLRPDPNPDTEMKKYKIAADILVASMRGMTFENSTEWILTDVIRQTAERKTSERTRQPLTIEVTSEMFEAALHKFSEFLASRADYKADGSLLKKATNTSLIRNPYLLFSDLAEGNVDDYRVLDWCQSIVSFIEMIKLHQMFMRSPVIMMKRYDVMQRSLIYVVHGRFRNRNDTIMRQIYPEILSELTKSLTRYHDKMSIEEVLVPELLRRLSSAVGNDSELELEFLRRLRIEVRKELLETKAKEFLEIVKQTEEKSSDMEESGCSFGSALLNIWYCLMISFLLGGVTTYHVIRSRRKGSWNFREIEEELPTRNRGSADYEPVVDQNL